MFSWNTLKIRNKRLFFWNLVFLTASFVFIEIGIRGFDLLSILPYPPNLGSGNIDFDLKVKYLDEFVEQNGPVECLILGSSLVDYGIDPDILRSRYAEITGEDLLCFNFGVGGSKANELDFIMEFVITRYHPDTIIYATWPRDYIFLAEALDQSAWIDYQMGSRSPRGWLVSNLQTIQFTHTALNMLWHAIPNDRAVIARTLANGYAPEEGTFPPDTPQSNEIAYRPYAENFQSLEKAVGLTQKKGIDLYVVAIPTRFESGKYNLKLYERLGADITQQTGEPYIALDEELLSQLSSENYIDIYHMNTTNANIYSRWLAEKIAGLQSQ